MNAFYVVAPFQSSFSISTNCDTIKNILYLQYGCYVTQSPRPVDFSFSIFFDGNRYMLTTPKDSHYTKYPVYEMECYLFENKSYSSEFLALHGAAVEWRNQAYLFLAPSAAGKTTLTCYLINQGFGYITEDCILLRKSDFHVFPYTAPIQLRHGSLKVLGQHNSCPEDLKILANPSGKKRYVFFPNNCIRKPLPLSTIYFIQRTDGEDCQIKLNGGECMLALMHSSITSYEFSTDYFRTLSQLAKNNCFRLCYSSMNYVKNLICSD